MSCAFDKEKLTGFFDGELDGSQKVQVESHISSCSECLRDLGEIKSTAQLVHQLPRGRAPRSIAEGVSREIAATGRVHSLARFRRGLLWATTAAAALLIVLNLAYFGPRWGSPEPDSTVALAPAAKEPAEAPAMSKAGYREAKEGGAAHGQAVRRLAEESDLVQEKKLRFADDRLAKNKQSENRLEELKRDLGRARRSEPAREPAAEALGAKAKAKQPAPAPSPKPAAPPAPRPVVRGKAAPRKGAAAPADEARPRAAGKASAPKPAPARPAEQKQAAAAPENAKRADVDRAADAKDAAPATEYLVSASDVATVRRSIEAQLRTWGVLPRQNEADKKLGGLKFRKLQEPRTPAPLEVRLTEAQLAALTKNLAQLKQVQVVDLRLAQRRGPAVPSRRPLTKSAGKKEEGESKKFADEQNRELFLEAEKAAQAPGAAKPAVRRVIFHFRRK